jgi:hypothetical protein
MLGRRIPDAMGCGATYRGREGCQARIKKAWLRDAHSFSNQPGKRITNKEEPQSSMHPTQFLIHRRL